jgi:hypothetical protein
MCSEHLTAGKVTVLIKRSLIFKHYVLKKHSNFGKNVQVLGHVWLHTSTYGKTGRVIADIIGTQVNVNQLTKVLESHVHKLHMDNFFSLSNLFSDLTKRKSTAAGET